MKRINTIIIVLICTVTFAMAGVYSPKTVPNVQLADSTKLVVNPDAILSPQAEININNMLRNIRSTTTAEPVVVMIDNMAEGYNIDDFATELFGLWKIGKADKDNGLLILVVKEAKKYCIRTGYGIEGILPDGLVGRIQRQTMAPELKKGDFDTGMINTVTQIQQIMTDPDAREDLLSAADDDDEDLSFAGFMLLYICFSAFITAIMAVYLIYKVHSTQNIDRHDRYLALRSLLPISKATSFLCLGFPLLVYFPVKSLLNKWRNGVHNCPNCGTKMDKLNEEDDNKYLTPAQDAEERLNSVDYDVWLCPNCGETDIYAYNNPNSTLQECPQCHARALRMVRDRIVTQPTQQREGQGIKDFQCLNCGKAIGIPYKIAKTAGPPIIIVPGGGRGGGFGGGGFGGGGFGGGMTGGGGASGGW